MTVDGDVAIASPRDCIDGALDTLIRLTRDFGVSVRFVELDPDTAGTLSGNNREALINTTLPLDDQAWQLIQVWTYLAIGPHASPDATPRRRLHPVPPLRSA